LSCSAAAEKLPVLATAANDIIATTFPTWTLSRIFNNFAFFMASVTTVSEMIYC
jgi:hypothetical protein